jgi:hypothetical protein
MLRVVSAFEFFFVFFLLRWPWSDRELALVMVLAKLSKS